MNNDTVIHLPSGGRDIQDEAPNNLIQVRECIFAIKLLFYFILKKV